MKPTQEQVEAARFFLYDWQMSGETVDDLAIRIAARDAERDAKWEALVRAWAKVSKLQDELLSCYRVGNTYRGGVIADKLADARAALANLGAEEKKG